MIEQGFDIYSKKTDGLNMEKIGTKKIYLLAIFMVTAVFLMRAPIERGVNGIKKALPQISEIEFVDSDGRVIVMDKPAERIISLETSHTQNIYSLGAGYLLLGVGYQEVYPLEIKELEKFNLENDAEAIVSANPDLVLITPDIRRLYGDQIDMLLRSGVNVVSLYPQRMEEIDHYLYLLGMTVGLEKKSQLLSEEILESIDKERVVEDSGRLVSFESSDMEMLIFEEDSFEGDMVLCSGGIYTEEELSADIYFSQTGFKDLGGSQWAVYERKNSDDIKAVSEGRVYEINKSISSPTAMISKGISQMKRLINPDEYRNIEWMKSDKPLTREVLAEMIVVYSGVQIFYPDYSYFSEERSRYYGDFQDVDSEDEYFQYIETAVGRGILDYQYTVEGSFFGPEEELIKEELAKAVWMMKSDFQKIKEVEIEDLEECQNPRIVRRLAEGGIFDLSDNKFNPNEGISCSQALEIFERLGEIND